MAEAILIVLTAEEKDQMLKWVEEAAGRPRPWWDHCSDPQAAYAFVQRNLPHLLVPLAPESGE